MAKKEYCIYTDFGFIGKTNERSHFTNKIKFHPFGISFEVDHKTSFGHGRFFVIYLPWSQIVAIEERNYKKS